MNNNLPFTDADLEIDFIKCTTWQDYSNFCHKYRQYSNNALFIKAFERYDDLYFSKHRSASGYEKYLQRFPNGRHSLDAQLGIYQHEEAKAARGETIENIGCLVIFVIFAATMIICMAVGHLTFMEAIYTQGILVPLYYFINKFTAKKD